MPCAILSYCEIKSAAINIRRTWYAKVSMSGQSSQIWHELIKSISIYDIPSLPNIKPLVCLLMYGIVFIT